MSDEYDDDYYDNWREEDEQAREEYDAQNSEDEQGEEFFIFGIFSGFFDWLFK